MDQLVHQLDLIKGGACQKQHFFMIHLNFLLIKLGYFDQRPNKSLVL